MDLMMMATTTSLLCHQLIVGLRFPSFLMFILVCLRVRSDSLFGRRLKWNIFSRHFYGRIASHFVQVEHP